MLAGMHCIIVEVETIIIYFPCELQPTDQNYFILGGSGERQQQRNLGQNKCQSVVLFKNSRTIQRMFSRRKNQCARWWRHQWVVVLCYSCINELTFCVQFVVDLYMSPVETWCHNLNYYIPDDARETKDFTKENMDRIRKFLEYFSQLVSNGFEWKYQYQVEPLFFLLLRFVVNLCWSLIFRSWPYSWIFFKLRRLLLKLIFFFGRYGPLDDCLVHCQLFLHVHLLHHGRGWLLENGSGSHCSIFSADADRLPIERWRNGTLAWRWTLRKDENHREIRRWIVRQRMG